MRPNSSCEFDVAQGVLPRSAIRFKGAHGPPMIVRTSAVLLVSPHFTWLWGAGDPPGANFSVACTMITDLRDDPKYCRFHAEEVLRAAECLEHEKKQDDHAADRRGLRVHCEIDGTASAKKNRRGNAGLSYVRMPKDKLELTTASK
jgi:hypothetical protein